MRKHHNRLYYGKHRHKTVFKLPGSLIFYPTTDDHLEHVKQLHHDLPDINFLADFIIKHRKKIKFRFQDRRSMFYTDEKLAKELINKFWDYWIGYETVDPKHGKLAENVIGCDRLPHGKYQYQIHIKKGADNILSESQRKGLQAFVETNVDNCLVSNIGLIDYIEDKSAYCYGGYMYITDERYLSPIYMMAQEAIEKVIKFRKVKNGSYKKTQG